MRSTGSLACPSRSVVICAWWLVYLAIYSPLWLCSGGHHPAVRESEGGVLPRAHEQHVQRHRLLPRQVRTRALVVSPACPSICVVRSLAITVLRLAFDSAILLLTTHYSDTSFFAVYRHCMLRLVSDLPLVAVQTFLHSLLVYWIAGYTSADHGMCVAARLCVNGVMVIEV